MARKTIIVSTGIGAGWSAIAGSDAGLFSLGLPLPLHNTLLSALIAGTVVVGLIWILRGPGYYRALRVGETIGEQKERRRHRCDKAAGSRAEVVTG